MYVYGMLWHGICIPVRYCAYRGCRHIYLYTEGSGGWYKGTEKVSYQSEVSEMTRKDYKQFANLLADARMTYGHDAECAQVIGDIEWGMIRIFAADNARFDPEQFIVASGGVVP